MFAPSSHSILQIPTGMGLDITNKTINFFTQTLWTVEQYGFIFLFYKHDSLKCKLA